MKDPVPLVVIISKVNDRVDLVTDLIEILDNRIERLEAMAEAQRDAWLRINENARRESL